MLGNHRFSKHTHVTCTCALTCNRKGTLADTEKPELPGNRDVGICARAASPSTKARARDSIRTLLLVFFFEIKRRHCCLSSLDFQNSINRATVRVHWWFVHSRSWLALTDHGSGHGGILLPQSLCGSVQPHFSTRAMCFLEMSSYFCQGAIYSLEQEPFTSFQKGNLLSQIAEAYRAS